MTSNERNGISNHQPHDCLLNRLFRRRWNKHQSSASLAFVGGIHRWPVNSPHKGPVTQKMFPFHDVIMVLMTIPDLCWEFLYQWQWNSFNKKWTEFFAVVGMIDKTDLRMKCIATINIWLGEFILGWPYIVCIVFTETVRIYVDTFILYKQYHECWWSVNIWWRHEMEYFPRYWLSVPWWGESTGDRSIPLTKRQWRGVLIFFDVRLNTRLNKYWSRRWFETQWFSLWRHCYGIEPAGQQLWYWSSYPGVPTG